MSHLTEEENQLLLRLNSPTCKVFGRNAVVNTLAIVGKLVVKLTDAEKAVADNELMANAFYGAAIGELTEAQIRVFPRFTDQQRLHLLKVVQTHYDAEAWRKSGALADAQLHDELRIG